MSAMNEENSWRTPAFRQSVVQKIEEAIRLSGMSPTRNSLEMESHVFQKAKSREEYLGFVARLILHVRENTKKGGMQPGPQVMGGGPQAPGGGPMSVGGSVVGGGMQDPINALQNLASQGQSGGRNPMPGNVSGMMGPVGGTGTSGPPGTQGIMTGPGGMQVAGPGCMTMSAQQQMGVGGPPNSAGLLTNMRMSGMNVGGAGGGPTVQMQQAAAAAAAAAQMQQQQQMRGGPMVGQMVGPGGGAGGQMMGPTAPQMVPGQMGGGGIPPGMQTGQMGPQQMGGMQMGMGGTMTGPGTIQMAGPGSQMGSAPPNQMQNAAMLGSAAAAQMQQLQQQQQMQQQQQQMAAAAVAAAQQQQQRKMEVGAGVVPSTQGGQMNSGVQGPQTVVNVSAPQSTPVGTSVSTVSSGTFPRNPTPTAQLFAQSPGGAAQSPAGMGVQTSGAGNNQMVPSPALAPSPVNHQTPGLMTGGPSSVGPPTSIGQQPRSVGGGISSMAPSPSSVCSLNTPLGAGQGLGGQGSGQSPMGGGGGQMHDEAAYRDKVRQLSKYIEPLRKMIARMGNDGEHVEKTSKMKKLLEILSNPQQRMPLETLLKCEVVLEKLDFRRDASVGSAMGGIPTPGGAGSGSFGPISGATVAAIYKEHNPLLEAVCNNLQSPFVNHTLHRTFGPTLEALFSPEIKLLPPLKRKKVEEPTSDIPEVLQGEIARLDQRFKVSLDPNQRQGSKTIQLICWLDDKNLPCVPPVSLTVPEDYPQASPKCHMAAHEYNATQFLSSVQDAFLARTKKLPKYYSVTQLLDTWEMSVRQASAPIQVPVCTTTLLMGL